MSGERATASSGGFGLGVVVFAVFLTLKLTAVVDWSWWWVTAPLWVPTAFVLLIAVVIGAATAVKR